MNNTFRNTVFQISVDVLLIVAASHGRNLDEMVFINFIYLQCILKVLFAKFVFLVQLFSIVFFLRTSPHYANV